MRLIDVNKQLVRLYRLDINNDLKDAIKEFLLTAPTIEPKHGHWREKIIYSHSYAECSECKTVYSWSESDTMRYCKMCGADMREVEE